MSNIRVGTCSLCGGSVFGFRGGWFGVNPPPPDTCISCGAVAVSDVIKMHPKITGTTSVSLTDTYTKVSK